LDHPHPVLYLYGGGAAVLEIQEIDAWHLKIDLMVMFDALVKSQAAAQRT
jgi:hypothetical protein